MDTKCTIFKTEDEVDLENIPEKDLTKEQKKLLNQKEIIIKKCLQPGIIRKDEVPCFDCKDIVID